MADPQVTFRVHALQRMFERRITENDVLLALKKGKIIASYSDDQPYPSRLVLGWQGTRPIHAVVADNEKENQLIVITVYEPDLKQWNEEFETRRTL